MNLKDTINYFCTDVDVDENGCWRNRTYKLERNGYLRVSFNSQKNRTTIPRLILIDRHGEEFMKNYVTRHLCNNKFCINPWHIIYGTQQENINDRQKAGRQAKGSKNGFAKLTEEEVKEIKFFLKQNNLTQTEIAKIFKTSNANISSIKNHKLWKHIN